MTDSPPSTLDSHEIANGSAASDTCPLPVRLWSLCALTVIVGCATAGRGSQSSTEALDPRVDRIVAENMGIDAHNHVDVPLEASQLPGPKVDLAGELQKSGLTAIGMTFALDYQPMTREGEAYDRFLTGLTAMDAILESNHVKRALTYDDVLQAHARHEPVVIQGVEGSHFLEGKIDRLQVAYARGLRHLGLLHDSDASVPLGDVYTNPPRWGGLTEFGATVVKECERLGILIDLTHSDEHTIDMILKIATRPLIVSHTGLDTQLGSNPQLTQKMKPRLISKEVARKVADAGGVICVWTHLSDTPAEYAQNIRAMVDVVGIDHVCLGTDTKLTPANRPPPKFESRGPKGPQGERVGERTNRAWKDEQVGFYYAVVDALLKAGFNEEEIRKLSGENYLRVFKAATDH